MKLIFRYSVLYLSRLSLLRGPFLSPALSLHLLPDLVELSYRLFKLEIRLMTVALELEGQSLELSDTSLEPADLPVEFVAPPLQPMCLSLQLSVPAFHFL